jgi:hypothetical protein
MVILYVIGLYQDEWLFHYTAIRLTITLNSSVGLYCLLTHGSLFLEIRRIQVSTTLATIKSYGKKIEKTEGAIVHMVD